jgi:hypothetical protein
VTNQLNIIVNNHRNQRFIALGLSGVALALSLAPRNERSLFITTDNGLKAFSVALPNDFVPPAFMPLYFGNGRRPAAFVRPSRPAAFPAGVPASGPAGFAPDEPSGVGGPDEPSSAILPASAPAGPTGSGFPFNPGGFNPSSASPAAGPATDAGSPPVVVEPSTPAAPGTTPAPVDGVVPAVPEPATWFMMIFGFLAVGSTLRYQLSSRRGPLKATEPS